MLLSVLTKPQDVGRNKQDLTGKISFLRTFQVDLLVHFEENGCNKIVYTLKFTEVPFKTANTD